MRQRDTCRNSHKETVTQSFTHISPKDLQSQPHPSQKETLIEKLRQHEAESKQTMSEKSWNAELESKDCARTVPSMNKNKASARVLRGSEMGDWG